MSWIGFTLLAAFMQAVRTAGHHQRPGFHRLVYRHGPAQPGPG